MRAESNAGLLRLMADREKDEKWAEAAFIEFYTRHKDYMYKRATTSP